MKTVFKCTLILLLFIMSVMFTSKADAKWWIFGQSEGSTEFRYLYLNGIAYDESGPKVTMYRDSVPGGLVTIKGRAATTNNKIGAVQISVDNKAKWDKARLSDDGTFDYNFRPEVGKEYVVYIRVIDTTGKTNDIEKTRKVIVVSGENIQALIKNTLNNLITAYQDKDPMKFMSQVSDGFVGDRANLERAIRKDFTSFDNIMLKYTLNNVSSDSKSKIFVSINFVRMLTSVKSGKTLKDNAMTEFVFQLGDQLPKIFSMKYPLIFGVSDAENVATGTVAQPANQNIIILDNKGDVNEAPYNEAKKQVQGEQVGSITAKDVSLNEWESFIFADETSRHGPGDINFFFQGMRLKNGTRYKLLGQQSVDDIKEVPDQGSYTQYSGIPVQNIAEGQVYALFLTYNKYVVFEIRRVNMPNVTIRYKYQTNGSRYF